MKLKPVRTIQTALFSGILFCSLLLISSSVEAQKTDTVLIHPGTLKVKQLPLGEQRYLVYFRNTKTNANSMFQFWTINCRKELYQNKESIIVEQVWEDNAQVIHKDFAVNSAIDFHPIFQKTWWKTKDSAIVDYENGYAAFSDKFFKKNIDSSRMEALKDFNIARKQYILNWHLDLEVFSMLPFAKGKVFGINFYEATYTVPKIEYYTVEGSEFLTDYNHSKIDCWILVSKTETTSEKYWICKKTKEVLKMEQTFGDYCRYKIKMGLNS